MTLEATLRVRKGKYLREQVYKKLKESILSGALKANSRLVEEKLAFSLGTSRTPIREAIQKLEKEGLVYKLPRGGYAVGGISEEDIDEVFGIRSILEGYAAYLAAQRITDEEIDELERLVRKGEEYLNAGDLESLVKLNTEFHEKLYKASKSKRLNSIISDLRDYIFRFRVYIFRYKSLAEVSLRDHKEMIRLMREGNAKKVESLVRRHIMRGKKLIKRKLAEEKGL